MAAARIPIVLCIDVEPDDRHVDPAAPCPWAGFVRAVEMTAQLREPLARATGAPAHFSWFYRMDPQIAHCYGDVAWVVRRYARLHDALVVAGDELGLHPHAFRRVGEGRTWPTDFADPSWVEHCIRVATAAFREVTGRTCRAFRFGDRFLTSAVVRLIEELGVWWDLSIEPGLPPWVFVPEPRTGDLPDYRSAPRVPYRPSESAFLEPDPERRGTLWMLPLSAAPLIDGVPQAEPPWYRASDVGHASAGDSWASLRLWHPLEEFRAVVERVLAELDRPYLAAAMRSDMAADPAQRRNIERNLTYLRDHPLARRFVFATPAEAMDRLRTADRCRR